MAEAVVFPYSKKDIRNFDVYDFTHHFCQRTSSVLFPILYSKFITVYCIHLHRKQSHNKKLNKKTKLYVYIHMCSKCYV